MIKINCTGDSHTSFFRKKQNFSSKKLGPYLAYSFKKHMDVNGRFRKFINRIDKNDYLMLCFGEIDCRAHILKQARRQNRCEFDITKDCVDRYIDGVVMLKDLGYKIILWGPIATSRDNTVHKKKFPQYGNEIERNKVTEHFNLCLENKTSNTDIKFISIFKKLITQDYKTKIEYYKDDGVHLSDKAFPMALKEFKANGIQVS